MATVRRVPGEPSKLAARLLASAFAIVAPYTTHATTHADLRLLDVELEPPVPIAAVLPEPGPPGLSAFGRRALLAASEDPTPEKGAPKTASPPPGSLDFDLLPPPPPAAGQDPALARRRALLNWHQGLGIGLFALTLATTTVGQLNYDDRFTGSRPSTGKYIAPHALLATTTLLTFAATGTLALLAPAPPRAATASTASRFTRSPCSRPPRAWRRRALSACGRASARAT